MRHAAPAAGTALRVNLLGRLEARTRDDRLIPLSGRHAQALFALLVLSRRPRSREAIAADLWPDSDATSSGALRQALWLVRHGLSQAGVDPHAILEIEPDTLGHPAGRDRRPRLDRVRGLPGRPAARSIRRSRCTGATWSRAWATTASPPNASACRTASRTPCSVAVANLARRPRGARRAAERLLVRDPLREEVHAVLIEVYGL